MRWWIVALLCLGTMMNYLSRNTLAILAATLMQDMGLTTETYSRVVAAFQLTYTIMQPVCGYVLDMLGGRLGFALFALLWSVAGCLHVFTSGWLSLAFFRGLLGMTEAAAIPAGVKAIAEWFPARERSVAMGFFNIGTSCGAMLAPALVVFVQVNWGWRAAFLVTGSIGFGFALLWWAIYRKPQDHPCLGAEERAAIEAGQEEMAAARKPSVRKIIADRRFWGIALPRFLAEPAWQTFNFWIPVYLTTRRGMNLGDIAWFAWLPFLAADMGSIAGGYLSPFFMRFAGLNLVQSRLAGIAFGALCMIGPGCIGLAKSGGAAIALFCIGGFAHQIISGLVNTLATDTFRRDEVGTASGLAGTAGWTGGLLFTLIVGKLADTVGFNPLFVSLSVFDLLAALAAFLLLRR